MTDDRPVTKTEIDGTAEGIVQTIIQWRIYDTLLAVLDALGGDATGLAKLHEAGIFLGPQPSFVGEPEGPIDLVADQPEPGN